jgi:hypothetical protein
VVCIHKTFENFKAFLKDFLNIDTIAYARSFNITELLLMPMAYQDFVFWIGEGYREERKKRR